MVTDITSGRWVSKAEAQVVLGISSATLERRLREGRFPKRTRENGTVEVLVPHDRWAIYTGRDEGLLEAGKRATENQQLRETIRGLAEENRELRYELRRLQTLLASGAAASVEDTTLLASYPRPGDADVESTGERFRQVIE